MWCMADIHWSGCSGGGKKLPQPRICLHVPCLHSRQPQPHLLFTHTPRPGGAGRLIAARMLASAAFRDSPHAIIYVHCAKLREVDTTAILEAAMAEHKRWVGHHMAATRTACLQEVQVACRGWVGWPDHRQVEAACPA